MARACPEQRKHCRRAELGTVRRRRLTEATSRSDQKHVVRNLFTDFKRTSKAYVRSHRDWRLSHPLDHARCSPAAAGSRPRSACWPASGDTIVTWNNSGWPRDMTAAALVCGSCGTELAEFEVL